MSRTICLATSILICLALAAPGCASRFKKQEKAIKEQPVNCATAQGDLRMLQHEKAHLAEEVVVGTEKTKLQVATGEYNRLIDQKMAAIKSECGL